MQFYSYFRSSASYRVRIALALKGIVPAEMHYVNLRADEQSAPDYAYLNPQALVPVMMLEDGTVLTQSLAIIEYLEETFPHAPALLPPDVLGRARVRALAQSIACDIQPLVNLRVLKRLVAITDEPTKNEWLHHWLDTGFTALEKQLATHRETGIFCHGNQPGLADCCLLPQVFSALRFDHDMSPYPTIMRIHTALMALPVLTPAHPAAQPDHF